MQNRKKHEIDMTQGSLFKNILLFAFPLMLTGVLQLFYNAADVIVVGRFAGSDSLAAVGSTNSLNNLIVNFFIGLSVGTAVLIAGCYGSRNTEKLHRAVHTAISLSVIVGICLAVLGFFISKPALRMMGSPEKIIGKSTLYLRIYFLGMPANLLYNFGSAILRSVGDTKRPLFFSIISGIVNVILNLIFVIVFHMDVAGVALATIISQALSAALTLNCLIRANGVYKLDLKKLKIHKQEMLEIIRIGLPSGFQSSLFSLSNVIIQSSVNSFGPDIMAGRAAAASITGFVYTAQNAFLHTSLTATAQNYGAKNIKRIKQSLFACLISVFVVGLLTGLLVLLFAKPILSIYTQNADAIAAATLILSILLPAYWMCGLMEVFVGALRGLGSAVMPMIVSLIGSCVMRVVWVYTVFNHYRTLESLFVSYPISWILTTLVHLICFIYLFNKKKKLLTN